MLRPQDTSTRERKSLNGLWRFVLDPDGEGRTARWFAGSLRGTRVMAVPASFNDIAADAAVRDYFGDVWYQRTCGCRAAGVVSGSCCTSSRRRTGHGVGRRDRGRLHEGGYTPFEVDITEYVSAGDEVRITAVVNNTLHWQSIPPGVIEDTPAGKRQRYWHDFFNYAGIHRNVWLYATNPAHFTDVTITTELDGANGVISYAAEATNAGAVVETKAILRDAEGGEVASTSGLSGTLNVPEVHKWRPGDGYLYDLELQLVDGDTVVDSYHQSVGVRTISGGRHSVPDQRGAFYFTGFGKHEDVPVIGKGTTTPTSCMTSSCSSGSVPTRSNRTTRTRRRSSITPIGRGSC